MSRALGTLDRLLALVIGLVLVAVGAAAIAWWAGRLAEWWPGTPALIDASRAEAVTSTTWWIWVALVAGLGAIALALRWLVAHLHTDGSGPVTLTGSSPQGHLTLDPSAVTSHYATLLGALTGVRTAHARLVRDGDLPVLEATTKIRPDADLEALAPQIVALTDEARRALGIDHLGARHRLSVNRHQRLASREPA